MPESPQPAAQPAPFDSQEAASRVVQVYAEALMRSAKEAGEVDQVGDELEAVVAGALVDHPAVEAFFASQAINRTAKLPVLAAAFDRGGMSLTFRRFVGVLNANRRLDLLAAVSQEFRALRDKIANRVRVKVTSAVDLTAAQATDLEATLARQLKATPVIERATDPAILGGLVVQVGDTVYDTSVKSRLDGLTNHLMASGTHG